MLSQQAISGAIQIDNEFVQRVGRRVSHDDLRP